MSDKIKGSTLKMNGFQGERVYDTTGASVTLIGNGGGLAAKTGLYLVSKKGYKKNNKDYASCLSVGANSGGNHSDMDLLLKDNNIRRLTPVECERLQGFPDNWNAFGVNEEKQIKISDTQRYKCCGNAVTVDIVELVGKRLLR